MRTSITLLFASLVAFFAASVFPQSIDKPLTVNPWHIFTWDDTNSPPCIGYTVYGQSQKTGLVTRTVATQLRQVTYGTLFGTNHPTGLNAVSVIGWFDGEASEKSTNYYVNWSPAPPPKPPPKGKPVKLRTL